MRKTAAAAVIFFAATVFAVVGSTAISTPAAAQTIEVQGNRRVDADTIRSYFRTRPGEPLDSVTIDNALKALYATGLYEDVRINRSGNRIVVIVVENATINRIAFEGNKKVNDEALANEVQSRPRGALSRPTVQADVQRIVEVYRRQGMFDVRVDPKIIDQPNGRVDLVFEVNEGDKTTVRRIVFVGNNKFSDWKLRDVINTQQTNWLSFLSNRDVYDPDRVAADQEMLRRHYLQHGYADFRILSATVDLDRGSGGFVLTFTLDEGEQYRFGAVEVLSNIRDADPASLMSLVRIKSGTVYNAVEIEKTLEELTLELSRRGYAFAQVRPRGDRDVSARIINIVFVVEDSARVYVERINIRGNTRTRDTVIRREFEVLEGDPYNRVLVDRAERRLKGLGYFKSVRVTNEPGSAPDRVIINVAVEEQLTGEFSVGAGYSTADGIIGEASISEKNLLGRGQMVRVSATYGQRSRGIEFGFTEPYFLGTRVAAGFDVFYRETVRSSYNPVDMTSVGGGLRLGLPLREHLTLHLRYQLYQREIGIAAGLKDGCRPGIDANPALVPEDPSTFGNCFDQFLPTPPNPANTPNNWRGTGKPGDPREVSLAYQQLEGTTITSLVAYSLNYNGLDDNQNPSSGFHGSFSQELAGLGGDVSFLKSTVDGRYYYPVTGELTMMVRGQAGHIVGWGGHTLNVLDHFFMGPNLVRGFAPRGIGPRDLGSTSQDALGASLYWGTSIEFIFPFPMAPKDFGLRAAVFADAGSAWGYDGVTNFSSLSGAVPAPTPCPAGSTAKGPASPAVGGVCIADQNIIRSSVGASVIWASPFGPLRFDYSWVLTKADFDRTQAFRFSTGGRF